jgi:hypothetical protein
MHNGKCRHTRKGISTIAAIFMLLLMFTAFIGLLIAYLNYNISAKEQMDIDHERSQEKIVLSKIELNNESSISKLVINNTGSIDVRIRALYEIVNGETKFIFDPSEYSETQIEPTKSLIINIPPEVPDIPFNNQTKILVATERGIKSLDSLPELVYGPAEPPTNYDPTKLYIGPLMLKFDDFFYHVTLNDGTLDPSETWQPGWIVDEKLPVKLAWNITVMNIDVRNLTITKFSSFNIVSTNGPNVKSWYIEPTDQINKEHFLEINQTEIITYIWDGPFSDDPQSVGPPFKDSTCMVFLTFFGVFHENDGIETPYAQTIPFEASITVVG